MSPELGMTRCDAVARYVYDQVGKDLLVQLLMFWGSSREEASEGNRELPRGERCEISFEPATNRIVRTQRVTACFRERVSDEHADHKKNAVLIGGSGRLT